MLSMLSEKLRISYPIFLVLAGLLISIIPGIPHLSLNPDMVFLIFLPPLLFEASWNTSWHEFLFFRRPIGMLAFGLVILTACVVAVISSMMIPGFTLALGFLLGGIISPPDAVAATSVLKELRIPKTVVTILEGESLVNDASSLIVFRVALASILTGQFVLWKAGVDFLLVSSLGVLTGLVIAHIIYAIYRFLPTTASIDTAISLISPYLMYITAEHFHYSGVLSVVSGGLFLSFRSADIFSYSSRLQVQGVWNTLAFLLNGVVFIMIGLQLPDIVSGLEGEYALSSAIGYGVVISAAAIVLRMLWVFPGAYMPRLLSKKVKKREQRPGWKSVFILGWSGMRGVVSLASALAIPFTLGGGGPFPHRNLILFITFTVILITLVLQGLSLPLLIRYLKIEVHENEAEQEQAIRLRLATSTLEYLQSEYTQEVSSIDAYARIKERYERMIEIASKKLAQEESEEDRSFGLPKYRKMLLDLVAVRRKELAKMHHEKEYTDRLIRKKQNELDLEEARLRR